MTGFKSRHGLALNLEESKDPPIRPRKAPVIIPEEDPDEDKGAMLSEIMKSRADDPTNFANENVMAKSNLRQPKSFNFGFPDSSSSGSEGESPKEAPLPPPPKARRGMAPLMSSRNSKGPRPML